jgi:cytochrome c553
MPQHISRLIVLLVIFAAAAYGAKRFFTVDSFYEYGHYRGNSVADIASDKPKYKGTSYCETCHTELFAEWSKGVHNRPDAGKVVKCEVCHGAGGERDARGMFQASATGPDHPKNRKLAVPADSRRLCTLCHEQITGRPAHQPQIVVADHAGSQQCVTCHNPHSPKLNLTPAAATAQRGDATLGKTKAAACAGCHGAEGVSLNLPGPSLAGQNAAYFVDALKAYTTGARDNPMMSALAQSISSEDSEHLAAYFSGLRCVSGPNAEKQAAAAQASASRCVACHGANGVTSNGAWPNLAGQSKDYLLTALKAYKDGTRKNAMMAGIANSLSEADAENVAAHYANLSCQR